MGVMSSSTLRPPTELVHRLPGLAAPVAPSQILRPGSPSPQSVVAFADRSLVIVRNHQLRQFLRRLLAYFIRRWSFVLLSLRPGYHCPATLQIHCRSFQELGPEASALCDAI